MHTAKNLTWGRPAQCFTDLCWQKTYTDPCEKSSWNQIFSLQDLPTEKNPFVFLSLTQGLSISSLIYLWLRYPHYVLVPPITSISIFLFQLWILMLESPKPVHIFLWGTESRTSGTLVNDRKNIPNLNLFQSNFNSATCTLTVLHHII